MSENRNEIETINTLFNDFHKQSCEIGAQSDECLEKLINAAIEVIDAVSQYTSEDADDEHRKVAVKRVRAAPELLEGCCSH